MSTTSKGIVLPEVSNRGRPSLKKVPPYWYPYRTNAKARWFDREILEVVSTEFRDRSVEYYVSLTPLDEKDEWEVYVLDIRDMHYSLVLPL